MSEPVSCCDLAAAAFADRTEQLRWAAARLPLASDTEAVHDVRVALRRLREAWRGFSPCLRGQGRNRVRLLRTLERQLGPLRDAEVRLELLVEVLGPVAVSRDRSDDPRRARAYGVALIPAHSDRVQPGLRGLEMEARRWLADSTAADVDREQRRVIQRRRLSRLERAARSPELLCPEAGTVRAKELATEELPRLFLGAARIHRGEAELHRRRIRVRRLRYRLELFAPALAAEHDVVLRELRGLQGDLGRFHDLAVLEGWIAAAAKQQALELRPALRRLLVRVDLERLATREAAEADLRRLDDSGWWSTAELACLS